MTAQTKSIAVLAACLPCLFVVEALVSPGGENVKQPQAVVKTVEPNVDEVIVEETIEVLENWDTLNVQNRTIVTTSEPIQPTISFEPEPKKLEYEWTPPDDFVPDIPDVPDTTYIPDFTPTPKKDYWEYYINNRLNELKKKEALLKDLQKKPVGPTYYNPTSYQPVYRQPVAKPQTEAPVRTRPVLFPRLRWRLR